MMRNWSVEKILKSLIILGLLALLVLIFSQKIELTSSDLGRHLTNGRVIWQNPQALFTNFYSYTEPNFSFVNHHWLAGVIFYLVYLLGGFKLLSLVNILLISLAVYLAFRLARRRANFYLVAALSIPVILLLSERVEVRPEIISYVLVILVWSIIDSVTVIKNYRRLLWLLPIFLFWVNTHIYFFIGLALLFFKWLAEFCEMIVSQRQSGLDWLVSCRAAYLKSRPWFYILWGSTLVCLLNPHHIVGLLYPFNIFSHYGYEIVENKSIFFLGHLLVDYNFSLFKILLVSLWLIWLLYFFICRRVSWFNLFLTLFFSALALMAVRNLPLFGLVWLVLVSANLSELLAQIKEKIPWSGWEIIKRWRIAIGLALLVVIICVGIYLAVTAVDQEGFIREPLGWGLTAGGEDSAKFFRDQHLSGPIFNNYDVGSALIFWLYPQTKVFVDNRPEAYSEQFFSSIYKPMQSEPAKWQAYSRQYQIKTVYFGYTDSAPWAVSFLNYILSDPDWALLYFDRYTVILANKKLTETSLLKNQTIGVTAFRQRLRELVTTSDLRSRFNLASLAKANRQNDLAEEIYRQIIFSQPTNRQALASLAYLYSGTTDKLYLNLALSYFQRAIEAGNDLPGIFDQLGLVYWHLQDYKNAELSWHLSLGRDSQDAGASYYLKQAADLRAQGKIN